MMKTNSFFQLKKRLFIGLVIALSIALYACDSTEEEFQDVTEEEIQESGVVRTEWKNTDSADTGMEESADDNKTAQPQPPPREKSLEGGTMGKGNYMVQVGAFLNKNNARRLIERLQEKGYNPTLNVSDATVKQWNIVRIGAYGDKRQAMDAAKAFSENENMESVVVRNNSIVKRQKAKVKKAVGEKVGSRKPTSSTSRKYAFQVGGLRTNTNALKYKMELKKNGYSPYVVKTKDAHTKDVWYAVRIGNFDTIEDAAEAATKFTEKANLPAKAGLIDN
ncbi:MAG: SPOR domain-containing protein [Proteobacteria bacterium]|nr:SPOR domain-containing protein [Pseudomonadota bacterium]